MQVDAPVVDWYVPRAQLVQMLAPDAVYVPTAQIEQLDLPALLWKVPDAQLVQILAPTIDEYVPPPQLTHSDAPTLSEYVPAAQLVQDMEAEAAKVPLAHVVHADERTAAA